MTNRITFLIEFEYDPDPSNYPDDCTTPEQMLALDLENASDDPASFIFADTANWEITGKVLP